LDLADTLTGEEPRFSGKDDRTLDGSDASLAKGQFVPSRPARPCRRLLAASIDWSVSFVIAFALGAPLAPSVWVAIVPVSVVAYFAFFVFRGGTPGMMTASIRIVDRRTRRAPSARKALARSCVALLQAAAVLALVNFAFSDTPTDGYSAADLAIFAASSLISLSAFAAHLLLFVDQKRRTLLDRLFGLTLEG
jgi:uncharacterized RDD family membrane protein YckC